MAEVVDHLPAAKSRGGRPSIYPWGQWFDGRVWRLEEGIDFNGAASQFRRGLGARATRSGGKVATRSDGKFLYIQFTKGVTPPPAAKER